MNLALTRAKLVEAGLTDRAAADLLAFLRDPGDSPGAMWNRVSRDHLSAAIPFAVHRLVYSQIFADRSPSEGPPPAWDPNESEIARTNIAAACRRIGVEDYEALRQWSIDERSAFWSDAIDILGIQFKKPARSTLDISPGVESPLWLPGAELNIADSCFLAPASQTAVIFLREDGPLRKMTYGELDTLSNRVANSLESIGIGAGDAIAITMPMTIEAVASYLGIVKAGASVVSIADSFAPEEIATRLRIAGARATITQDVVIRAGKQLPMYDKVVAAGAQTIIVVSAGESIAVDLRASDKMWFDFLVADDAFESVPRQPDDTTNVLFSSGTTGEPKAIPWTHTTPIKCAVDGFYHHDLHSGDVVAWPTNLGWMMGPWLIYASLLNRGTMALYYGTPNSREFCEFVRDARVNMLGVVPSLVKAWRATGAVDGVDWSAIEAFSSTGEASNADDMLWLMSRAGYRPVVEYCGGTEVGGGYITQTLVQPASPATFSTPALGLDIYILDENGKPADEGELFIAPPSIGLSQTLLNRDHHGVYYHNVPVGPKGEVLRRHGDQMERMSGGYFRAQGRADDTMNLGGIKISSAEIERVASTTDGVLETAAIAVEPEGGGPSRLVIFTVLEHGAITTADTLKGAMQKSISSALNPLFRVYDVAIVDVLPRTASNKVMRRVLRDQYPKARRATD